MRKICLGMLMFGVLILGISLSMESSYAENISNEEIINEITKERPEYAIEEIADVKRVLSQENKDLISSFEIKSTANKKYVATLIENLEIRDDITDEEFNSYITDSIEQKQTMDSEMEKELQDKVSQFNKENNDDNPRIQSRLSPVEAAERAYQAGVLLVLNRGVRMTATYMQHARVPSPLSPAPRTYVSRNDEWANQVGSEIIRRTYSDFKRNGLGKKTYTQRGSHAFTSGDLYTALHKVSYTVNYVQRSNGGYAYTVTVSDVFDFAWGNYNNIAGGFGNNYCVAMQTLRLIKPFNISIVYSG